METNSSKTIIDIISSDAFIGVIGTLLGTILGWILNNITNKGKLSIFLKSWDESYLHYNQGNLEKCDKIGKTNFYSYNSLIEIYNSSSRQKIMRSWKIRYCNGRKLLKEDIPKNEATKIQHQHFATYYEMEAYNIPPHSVVTVTITNSHQVDSYDLSFLKSTNRLVLEYRDEKNRIRRITLKKTNYEKLFQNNTIAEE